MTWILDNSDVVTIAAMILTPTVIIGLMIILASGNTPEANELEGFPHDE